MTTPDMFPTLNRRLEPEEAREKFAELFTAVAGIRTREDLSKLCFEKPWIAFPSHLWTQAGPCSRCGMSFPKLDLRP